MKVEFLLDVLKPHQPDSYIVAKELMKITGVSRVSIRVDELDQKTASLHIHIVGNNLSLEEITETLGTNNCALHSVDEVICEEMD
ncbi:MAG: DUF211 domain-containing protein [Candidatus Lokiarchaeota archaeon]|nr:DUF211 domain-containing protein [Candidatus Lokiarchaeota archaeon]